MLATAGITAGFPATLVNPVIPQHPYTDYSVQLQHKTYSTGHLPYVSNEFYQAGLHFPKYIHFGNLLRGSP